YAYDPTLLTDRGAILLRPGKPGRRDEPVAFAKDLAVAGIAVLGEVTEPAVAEGGDFFLLDETTLLAGRAYRTNDTGIGRLRDLPDRTTRTWLRKNSPILVGQVAACYNSSRCLPAGTTSGCCCTCWVSRRS